MNILGEKWKGDVCRLGRLHRDKIYEFSNGFRDQDVTPFRDHSIMSPRITSQVEGIIILGGCWTV